MCSLIKIYESKLWTYPWPLGGGSVYFIEPHWWQASIGSGSGLLPSASHSLKWLTQCCQDLRHHMVPLGCIELITHPIDFPDWLLPVKPIILMQKQVSRLGTSRSIVAGVDWWETMPFWGGWGGLKNGSNTGCVQTLKSAWISVECLKSA